MPSNEDLEEFSQLLIKRGFLQRRTKLRDIIYRDEQTLAMLGFTRSEIVQLVGSLVWTCF